MVPSSISEQMTHRSFLSFPFLHKAKKERETNQKQELTVYLYICKGQEMITELYFPFLESPCVSDTALQI